MNIKLLVTKKNIVRASHVCLKKKIVILFDFKSDPVPL